MILNEQINDEQHKALGNNSVVFHIPRTTKNSIKFHFIGNGWLLRLIGPDNIFDLFQSMISFESK